MQNDHQCTFFRLGWLWVFLNTFICNCNAVLNLLPTQHLYHYKEGQKEAASIPKGPIYELSACRKLESFVFLENVMGEM